MTRKSVVTSFISAAGFAAILGAASAPATSNISVDSGTAAFTVNTNVSAISVKGKSGALQGKVQVRQTSEGLKLEQVEAVVPVASLNTGMGIRDQHMRKFIFTAPDGATPDLKFSAPEASCTPSAKENICQISGELAIRGVAKPFNIQLKVRENGTAFRASASGTVKLSDYGIEPPSQFGVKTANEVQLQLEFTGKQAPTYSASAAVVR
ncbi:MAG TPA: YceI family protein [Bryobacteraceae bacterium]|nr:YceI family protein [Bryobacteraceae bacterium]